MNLARSNVILLIAAAVLVVPTWLQLRREADVFTDIARIPLLFDGFTKDNVGQILLAQPKKEQPAAGQPGEPQGSDPKGPDQKPRVAYDQLQLQRTDKGFQLGMLAGDRAGVPVNRDRVEADVFAHLGAIRVDRETLVQPNATPEQLTQFGLDEAHAFVIRAIDASGKNIVLAELMVGREAGAGQTGAEAVRGVFVRKSDSNDVVLYEIDKPWRRDVLEEGWIDKTLARIETDKVRRLSIRNTATAGTTYVFERPDNRASWAAKDPPADVGAVRQAEVESIVQRLRFLAVQDYRLPLQRAGNLQQLGLQPPQIEVEIVVRENDQDRVITLAVGNKVDGKNEYYLQSSESPFLLTWPAGFVTQYELDCKQQLFDPKGPTEAAPTDAPRDDKE